MPKVYTQIMPAPVNANGPTENPRTYLGFDAAGNRTQTYKAWTFFLPLGAKIAQRESINNDGNWQDSFSVGNGQNKEVAHNVTVHPNWVVELYVETEAVAVADRVATTTKRKR